MTQYFGTDQLDLEAIDSALTGTIFQGRLHHLPTVGSTNTHALEQARKAAAQEQAREQFSRFMTGSGYSPSSVKMFHY